MVNLVPDRPVTTHTLALPGAELRFDVRGNGPLLVLHGAPMDAAAFVPLAERLAIDHTVVTSDPRGIGRSTVADAHRDVSPDERADDVAALIAHVDAGPAQIFGTSGGAVSALSLLQRHAHLVDLVIAHEPPLAALLADRDELRARSEAMVATYLAGHRIAAWRSFLDIAGIAMPAEVFDAVFGDTPEGQQAADERFSFAHMDLPTTFWAPDLDALARSASMLVIGIGEESAGQLCDRTSRALGDALGIAPTAFPGDHVGFVDDPTRFAERLRDVLARICAEVAPLGRDRQAKRRGDSPSEALIGA